MNKLLFSLVGLVSLLISCSNDPRAKLPQTGDFGMAVSNSSTINVQQFYAMADTSIGSSVNVTGEVANFCKGEGCWLTLKNDGGEDLFVEVENKSFVLPYHIDGKKALISGTISHDPNDSSKVSLLAKGIQIR